MTNQQSQMQSQMQNNMFQSKDSISSNEPSGIAMQSGSMNHAKPYRGERMSQSYAAAYDFNKPTHSGAFGLQQNRPLIIPVFFDKSDGVTHDFDILRGKSTDMLKLMKFYFQMNNYDVSKMSLVISNPSLDNSEGQYQSKIMVGGINAPQNVITKCFGLALSNTLKELGNQFSTMRSIRTSSKDVHMASVQEEQNIMMESRQSMAHIGESFRSEMSKFMSPADDKLTSATSKTVNEPGITKHPKESKLDAKPLLNNKPRGVATPSSVTNSDTKQVSIGRFGGGNIIRSSYADAKSSLPLNNSQENSRNNLAFADIDKNSSHSMPQHKTPSPQAFAVAVEKEPPRPVKTIGEPIKPVDTKLVDYKEVSVEPASGKSPSGEYQPENTLALLRSNKKVFFDNVISHLERKNALTNNVKENLTIGFSRMFDAPNGKSGFNIVFNDVGVSDKIMTEAFEVASMMTIHNAFETGKETAKNNGFRYVGPNDGDAVDCKVDKENVRRISKEKFDATLKEDSDLLYKDMLTAETLMRGEPYPCPDKKIKMHEKGALGIKLYNDGNNPKTVDGYRTKLCDSLNSLKEMIDEELGLSYEESHSCTLDISRTFKRGDRAEFMIAFSGYDKYAAELQLALRKSVESMFGGALYNQDYEFFKMSTGEKRILPDVLNDTTKFESPDVYYNSHLKPMDKRGLLTYDNRAFSGEILDESLLPSSSQSMESNGPQF